MAGRDPGRPADRPPRAYLRRPPVLSDARNVAPFGSTSGSAVALGRPPGRLGSRAEQPPGGRRSRTPRGGIEALSYMLGLGRGSVASVPRLAFTISRFLRRLPRPNAAPSCTTRQPLQAVQHLSAAATSTLSRRASRPQQHEPSKRSSPDTVPQTEPHLPTQMLPSAKSETHRWHSRKVCDGMLSAQPNCGVAVVSEGAGWEGVRKRC